jgi:hypothetical protein
MRLLESLMRKSGCSEVKQEVNFSMNPTESATKPNIGHK